LFAFQVKVTLAASAVVNASELMRKKIEIQAMRIVLFSVDFWFMI
jgi:hypothetical protein